jgi:hypothetical protein
MQSDSKAYCEFSKTNIEIRMNMELRAKLIFF